MKLADELFKRYVLIEESLLVYGFRQIDNKYIYNKLIHNNEFEIQVTIKNSVLDAKLIDKEFDDEYPQIDVEALKGGFLSTLKEECSNVLIDIRNNCFKKVYFIYDQANKITEKIIKKYDSSPEFLWEKYPYFGAFRNKKNNKWFALISNVDKNKLIAKEEGEVELINLKLDELTNSYLNNKGIYKAYHMSKKNWVSVILDNTITDDEIMKLIDISYINSLKK